LRYNSAADSFWATVCKTVCPMLSVRCLSCPVVCLSVTFVHCDATTAQKLSAHIIQAVIHLN